MGAAPRRDARHALARHDEILRDAVEAQDGVIFSEMGDGMAAAFPSAPCALHACLDAQLAFRPSHGRRTQRSRARMGLHAAEGQLRADGQYVNTPLNRCARLMAVAHGGQVVCSDSVEVLVRGTLPHDVSLLDLGEHRLRDLTQPIRVYQLLHPDLRADFPQLVSLGVNTNLPVQLTSFVGRRQRALGARRAPDQLSPRHAHGSGRSGQDPPRSAGRGGGAAPLRRRSVARRTGSRRGSGGHRRNDRQHAQHPEPRRRPGRNRDHRSATAQHHAARARQLRARTRPRRASS